MWEALKKEGIDLEPPVPLQTHTYLGCGQHPVKPVMNLIAKRREMFDCICHNKDSGKPINAEGDLSSVKPLHLQPSGSKAKKSNKKKNGKPTAASLAGGGSKPSNKFSDDIVKAYCYDMNGHVKQNCGPLSRTSRGNSRVFPASST